MMQKFAIQQDTGLEIQVSTEIHSDYCHVRIHGNGLTFPFRVETSVWIKLIQQLSADVDAFQHSPIADRTQIDNDPPDQYSVDP